MTKWLGYVHFFQSTLPPLSEEQFLKFHPKLLALNAMQTLPMSLTVQGEKRAWAQGKRIPLGSSLSPLPISRTNARRKLLQRLKHTSPRTRAGAAQETSRYWLLLVLLLAFYLSLPRSLPHCLRIPPSVTS